MSVGSAVGVSSEDVQEDLENQDLLSPWARTSSTKITYGGLSIDTSPSDQSGTDFMNTTGQSVTNTQIGTTESAFNFARRARGTPTALEVLQNNDVIGWYAFSGYSDNNSYQSVSGTQGVYIVSGTNQNAGNLNFMVKRFTDTNPTIAGSFKENHDLNLTAYVSSRDDGYSATLKYAYFDTSGNLKFGPIHVYEIAGPEDDINNTTAFETVLTVSKSASTPAGFYELVATGTYSYDNANTNYECRVLQGTTQLGQLVSVEPKDAAGVGTAVDGSNSGTDNKAPLYIRRIVQLSEASTQTFSFQHRSTQNSVEASIFDLLLTLELKKPL